MHLLFERKELIYLIIVNSGTIQKTSCQNDLIYILSFINRFPHSISGNVDMENEEHNPSCPNNHKTTSTDKTPMVVGIIVLAAVAFIISLTILFTYQIEKRQRLRNCRERNVQAETSTTYIVTHFLNYVFPEQSQPNKSLIKKYFLFISIHPLIKVN